MINVTGTLINLYQVCKRETWLHANGIRMEHTSDVVTSYPNRAARYEEVRIGGSVIDFYDPKEKVIHEIKKSTSKEEAYIWQVKYYLLLFEREGIADVVGMLEYPLLRETMRVELEEGDREILRQMEVEIRQLIGEEACPPALSKGKCGACSYYEFTPVDEEGQEGQPRYIPIETVDNLFVFGSLDTNSMMYNFLGKHQVAVHFFDYYEHYTGSFMPKDYLLSGKMQIAQMKHHIRQEKRMAIARSFIDGAAFNMLKNLRYYTNRGKDTRQQIERIEAYIPLIATATDIPMLMGIEGNIRQTYYEAFDTIIDGFSMGNRTKMPPSNEVNAMISFANSMCYSLCLDAIYHTQLNPTISFLHEPGERRYSLALDMAEIFKPILADRLIFSMFNRKQLRESDFDQHLNRCLLKQSSMKKVAQEWEERTKETIKHRKLGRSVSYRHLI